MEIPAGDEFYFQWHLTERCNQRCAHCYHESYASSGELTLADLKAVFFEMERALHAWNRIGSFSLTGGEPFMRREELFALMERLDSSDVVGYYDILTNGSLLSAEDVRSMSRAPKLRRVQLSLEGPSAASNDAIRGAGAFNRTLAAIDQLKDEGVEVAVMTTITKRNKDSLPELLDLLASHRVDTFAMERFIPEGSGAEIHDSMLTPREARETFELVHALGVAERRLRVLMYRPLFALVDSEDPTVGAMCSVGTNALTVMHDGTVYPCRRLPIPLGHVLRDGLFKIWYDSDFLWRVREPANLEDCGSCDLAAVCRGCRAMAYSTSGDCCGPDPHCWRSQKCTA
ncbi:MAG: radical SAM protein [Coriobacteriia bacterium]|nr:radical SAM protein [Coriobacteriia bacterium]